MTAVITHANCKACGKKCKITKDGGISNHGHKQQGATNSRFCPGSGFTPSATHEMIAARVEREVEFYRNREGWSEEGKAHHIAEIYRVAARIRARANRA